MGRTGPVLTPVSLRSEKVAEVKRAEPAWLNGRARRAAVVQPVVRRGRAKAMRTMKMDAMRLRFLTSGSFGDAANMATWPKVTWSIRQCQGVCVGLQSPN